MKKGKLLILCTMLLCSTQAQVRWMLGVGYVPSPRTRIEEGYMGLQTKSDRTLSVGIAKSVRRSKSIGWGVQGTLLFRSPFYELDRSVPYYPRKPHIPTYRFEALQLFPYLYYSRSLFKQMKSLTVEARGGPAFVFHGGNAMSTTTAYATIDRSPFVLYRLGLDRHPMGIPFLSGQLGVAYAFRVGQRMQAGVHPYVQGQWGDRSRIWYQSTPLDPIHTSRGYIKNSEWSFGFLCRFERRSSR